MSGKNKLTAKQQRFVEEYLVDNNATQAAIRAGYSEKTAKESGYENLTKPHIAEAIAEKRKKISEKTMLTIEGLDQYILDMAQMAKDACDFSGMNGAADKWGKRLNAFNPAETESKHFSFNITTTKDT